MSNRAQPLLCISILLLAPSCATNGFRKFYRGNLGGRSLAESGLVAQSATAQIVAGGDRADDDARMLESGYRMVGLVFFDGVEQRPDAVLEVANEVGATAAIVYKRPSVTLKRTTSAGPAHRRLHMAAAPQTAGLTTLEHGATFWAPTSAPASFGALVQDGGEGEAGGDCKRDGLPVLAVVRESPAHRCGVRRGDFVVKVAGKPVANVEAFLAMVNQSLGQVTEFEVLRNGSSQSLACEVGARPENLAGMPPDH